MPRLLRILLPFPVAAVHAMLYLALFGQAFALGDAGLGVPVVVQAALAILGAPMMYLLNLPPEVFAPWGRWWGDDANFIIGLATLNSLVWGYAVVWVVSRWLRRHAIAV